MTEQKRDFDKDAATWEENPARVRMAERVFTAIVNRIVLTSDMEVMDFGCGTGLLSMRLLPFVSSVVGVDSSAGMLGVFRRKVLTSGLSAISARLVDLDNGDTLEGSYDLVTSSMTMHHIREVKPLIEKFASVLKPGGLLGIADLDSDNGEFHDNPAGVFHDGFDRAAMKKQFEACGFTDVTAETAAEVTKPGKDGVMKTFTIFLVTGRLR